MNRKFLSLFLVLAVASGCAFAGSSAIPPKSLSDFQEERPKIMGIDTLEFLALGDAGNGNRGQKQIADAMIRLIETTDIRFSLYLGDNFYPSGVSSVEDEKWETHFAQMYPKHTFNFPFYVVLGNHDYEGNVQAQIDYSKISEQWTMPERYYTFEKSLVNGTKITFIGIDTEAILNQENTDQLEWLQKTLSEAGGKWKIVFGHHSLYSGDQAHGYGTDRLREMLLPILTEGNADLYLSGHSHSLQFFQPEKNLHFAVSGAGSTARGVRRIKNTLYAGSKLGFTWLRVSNESIEVMMMNAKTENEFYYSIDK